MCLSYKAASLFSPDIYARLKKYALSMAAGGKAEENGYTERITRTIKEEQVDLSEFFDFAEAAQQIRHIIEYVNMTKRILSSLRYWPPAAERQKAASGFWKLLFAKRIYIEQIVGRFGK